MGYINSGARELDNIYSRDVYTKLRDHVTCRVVTQNLESVTGVREPNQSLHVKIANVCSGLVSMCSGFISPLSP
jgi:hypothetical protein